MSNDLISRSTLMSHIESERRQWGEDYDAEQILGDIEDFPTAYDMDNVVSQLEDYGNEEMCYYKNTPYEKCVEECINKAIEIVKRGGAE